MRDMGRIELSETSDVMQIVRAEFRQSDERINAMFREMEEANRQRSVETDKLVAATEAYRRESLAFRQELHERIDRLPPPAQAA
jgi:hypothetical protein